MDVLVVVLERIGVAGVVDAAAPVVAVADAQEVLQLGAFGFCVLMMPPICTEVKANILIKHMFMMMHL